MEIKPIRTEEDYRATLEAGTREGERLDVLVTLVEAYERKNFPLDLPDPVEAIVPAALRSSSSQSGRAGRLARVPVAERPGREGLSGTVLPAAPG